MSAIKRLIHALLPTMPSQHERDEAYLGEAVDIYDLERRMRHLDQRGRSGSMGQGTGLVFWVP
jgi:hypothetical protein